MSITLQPVAVETNSADKDGLLFFSDGRLVGVLVHLEDPIHGETLLGSWYLECAIGKLRDAYETRLNPRIRGHTGQYRL